MTNKSLTPYEASLLAGLALADLKGLSAAGLRKLVAAQAGRGAKAIAKAMTSKKSTNGSSASESADAIKRWAAAQTLRR